MRPAYSEWGIQRCDSSGSHVVIFGTVRDVVAADVDDVDDDVTAQGLMLLSFGPLGPLL